MATENLRVRSGNQIEILFDNVVVGLAQNCRLADDLSPEPASGIGDEKAVEYVPTMARYVINLSQMQLRNQSLRAQGIKAENSAQGLKGMVFDVVIRDKQSGQELRKYMGVSYASGEIDVQKHQILVASGMFYALDATGTLI